MTRKRSRAKNLEPRPCQICRNIFQPYTCRQILCGSSSCQREYDIEKAKEYYLQLKEREKGRKEDFESPEIGRKWKVEYTKILEKWFWKAVADNGSVLENGPFKSREEARKDYREATE